MQTFTGTATCNCAAPVAAIVQHRINPIGQWCQRPQQLEFSADASVDAADQGVKRLSTTDDNDMKVKILATFVLSGSLLGGCAAPPTNASPPFVAGSGNQLNKIVLIVRAKPPKYSFIHAPIPGGGIIAGIVDQGNVSNPGRLAEAFKELPNLYDQFNLQLASNLRARGLDVVEVVRDADEPLAMAAAATANQREWVFSVADLHVGYHALTIVNAYKPRAFLSLVPYNFRTDTLYAPISEVIETTESKYSFAIAENAIYSPSDSFAGLAAAISEAARTATIHIVGNQ